MAAVIRAAIYLRVSSKEQTNENQERELRAWADRLGLEKVRVYAETASGARGDRAALAQVLAAAHRREYDTLLIWALDRLSREGIGPMARYLEELKRVGVRVMSYREPWLDTAGPVGELLVAVFAWVASQERARHIERVRSGQARAREAGIHLGRPRRVVDLSAVSARREAGETWREIAVALKIPTRTLRRHAEAGQKYLSAPQVRDLREPALIAGIVALRPRGALSGGRGSFWSRLNNARRRAEPPPPPIAGLAMTTKQQVIEFLESHGSVNVARLMSRFRLQQRAAESHLQRLLRQGLIAPSRAGSFVLSNRGHRWLAWSRGQTEGGRITFT